MKFIDKIKNIFNSDNSKTYSINDESFWNTVFGNNITKEKLSDTVYFICLKTLAESVAKLPLKLYKNTDKGIEKANNKKIYNYLKIRPNPYMSASNFWATVEILRNHYGNCYVYQKKVKGKIQLYILDNNSVQVYDDNAKILSNNASIWYLYTEPSTGKLYKIHDDNILNFKTSMSFDGIKGLSIQQQLKLTIDSSLYAQNFLHNLFKSGLTGKVGVEHTADLNDKLRDKLVEKIKNAADAGNSSVNFIPLPLGTKLAPLNLKLTDAQFLELKKYSALQIAAAFGVKPNQLNDYEKSSYANSEMQQLTFYKDTLLFILKQYEDEMNYKLLTDEEIEEGYFFKFNADVLLRADIKTRMEAYSKAVQNAIYTPDECREKEDLPFEEGSNKLFVNSAIVPIEDAGLKGGEKNA